MARCDLGKTIIDELRLCYIAEPTLLSDLSEIEFGKWKSYDEFTLYRVAHDHFQYGYDVFYDDGIVARQKVATLKFGRFGEQEATHYLFYRVENPVLYDSDLMKCVLRLPEMLGCVFNNFSAIDLCRDYQRNVTRQLISLLRDKDLTAIINGKAISKTDDIMTATLTYTLNCTRIKNPTLSIKQAKAVKDKTKGLTLCGYNKNNEIETSSHKSYIAEFYDNPRTLHRLEVHQNSAEIKDFLKKYDVVPDISLIFDQQFLDKMYEEHLSSLLRFSKGRKPLKWSELLQ